MHGENGKSGFYFLCIASINIYHQDKADKLLKIQKKKKKNTITVTYSLVVTKFPGGRDDMTERNKTHVNLLEYGSR